MDISPEPPDPPDPPEPPPVPPVPPPVLRNTHKRTLRDDDSIILQKKTITDPDLASASVQTLYRHPDLVVGIKAYRDEDKGPFIVVVSKLERELTSGLTMKPIKFGQFLTKNKIQYICRDGIKKIGRNKISVEFKSPVAANKFISNPILEQHDYSASIPSYNISKLGIVRQVPIDLSMEDFVESVVLPPGCGLILKARRLNRKTITDGKATWIPSQTVVLTFRGQVLPGHIYSFYTSLHVEAYQFPTIQCLACCRFGHIKAQCRSKPRCYRCAQPHLGDECNVDEPFATCMFCSGSHFSINKHCPEQNRQKSIKTLMSQEGISYMDAAKQLPNSGKSFSQVLSQESSSPSVPSTQLFINRNSVNSTHSYKKSIYSSPRPRPSLGKSYDRVSHNDIIASCPSSQPNGCALFQSSQSSMSPQIKDPQQDTNIVQFLLSLLLSLISENKFILPSHVAEKLNQITSYNGSNSNNSVEL